MIVPEETQSLSPRLAAVKELGIGAIGLLVANAAVLLCYFVYDLTLFQLVLVYWCECLWIGVASAGKLIVASIFGDPYENRFATVSGGTSVLISLFLIVFTSSSYFSLLGMALMGILFANENLALSTANDDVLNHIGLVLGVSGLLLGGHLLSFFSNFFLLREYKTAKAGQLIALPFKRSLGLLVVIVLSIWLMALVPRYANTASFAVAVIALKVIWDVGLHTRERRQLAGATKPAVMSTKI
ncbi:MAG: hypothetical protein HKN77_06805 [Woeseiaceae bacterium]|nr:hypothetical protein [Woeseiaceae bacterium]